MCPKINEKELADDKFCDSTFFMWFARTQIATIEPEPVRSPLEEYEENRSELRVLEIELAAAEKAIRSHIGPYNKDPRIAFLRRGGNLIMYARLNAMTLDPTLQKLEWNRSEILRKRAAKLAGHARLKQLCGLTSY